ncbi:hypothetical protein HMPREF9999_01455 [Alloprevotella sp. oral taxon 473 str. F0040]|nr:hypothetical protein HMPREF9999_01455 [Alloprevotella sp. oral taxon 473 str. F0040]
MMWGFYPNGRTFAPKTVSTFFQCFNPRFLFYLCVAMNVRNPNSKN